MPSAQNGGFEVFTHGGRKPSGRDAVEWAKEAEAAALEKSC